MAPEDISLLEGSCLKAAAVQLEPDVLHTLDSLYVFYHRQWWCYSHMYHVFKVRQAFLKKRRRTDPRSSPSPITTDTT